jgi:hypothetical protein
MIIISYFYKKPIVIVKHRYEHKYQMCKKDELTNLNLITQNNMIHFQH